MRKRLAALIALIAATLTVASVASADNYCATSACRADTGMWGSTIPSWVHPGHTSNIYLFAKDNGPASTYGVTIHATIPYQLKILSVKVYYGNCTLKGTFLSCYLGNFRREQSGEVVVHVQTTKKGTYEIPAHVYTTGVDDPNGGNNQVTATLSVYPPGK